MTTPLQTPGLLPLRPVPGRVTAQGRKAPATEVLANACFTGDRDLIGVHALTVIQGGAGRSRVNHSPAGPWLALAASRVADPPSVTDIHTGWTERLSEELDNVCVEAYAHGIVEGPALDEAIRAIWSAAFLVEMHDYGGVCDLIDALMDAEIVWVARQVAQACHDHNGRYNEISHIIKRIGDHAATDPRGFTGWNTQAGFMGTRWSARPDAPSAVLCPTAARLRRIGGPHLALALDYAHAAVLAAPTEDYPLHGMEAITRDLGDSNMHALAVGLLEAGASERLRVTAGSRERSLPRLRRKIAARWKGSE